MAGYISVVADSGNPQAPAAGEATVQFNTTQNRLKVNYAGQLFDAGTLSNTPGIAKTIVDGSATSLFEVVCTTGQMVGGTFSFLVRASDGTEFQADAGFASYSAVNKAGTITRAVTYVAANEAKSVTGASTLTLAFTMTDDTNKATVKVQPTGSLTETTYTIEVVVTAIRGAVTIL